MLLRCILLVLTTILTNAWEESLCKMQLQACAPGPQTGVYPANIATCVPYAVSRCEFPDQVEINAVKGPYACCSNAHCCFYDSKTDTNMGCTNSQSQPHQDLCDQLWASQGGGGAATTSTTTTTTTTTNTPATTTTSTTTTSSPQTAAPAPRDWFFHDHGAGTPARCGPNGNGLECASDNNKDCKWGHYGTQAVFSKMSGVTASAPLLGTCPGWQGSYPNACDVLGCDDTYRFYYLAGGAGTPVRCNPNKVDELQCASDNNKDCKWGTYDSQIEYSPMINVVSKDPLSIACPGWNTKDGKDMCAQLQCYSTPPTTTGTTRDCSVLAIDEFLLQCSTEFPTAQQQVSDLEVRLNALETNLQGQVDTNAANILQLQNDVSNGGATTAAEIQQLQDDIDSANARIDLFAAKSANINLDGNYNGNNNGFSVTDGAILVLLMANFITMGYIYCWKKNEGVKSKKHGYVVPIDEDSDVEEIDNIKI